MKKSILTLSVILAIGLSACGSSSITEEASKGTDVKNTEMVSEEINQNVNDTSASALEDSEELTPTYAMFKLTRDNEQTIIDDCILAVDVTTDNRIRITLKEDKVSSFVRILEVFFEQSIKLYINDTLIATLDVDDNVRNGILIISNVSEDDVDDLVKQLESSIQSDEHSSEQISLEDRLYNVADEAIGSDDRIQNIVYDATNVKFLITAGIEDEALLIEFSILYKMKDEFENMKVMFVFYTEEGNASSAIRKSSYSADTRKNMDLDAIKDYHDLLNYAE